MSKRWEKEKREKEEKQVKITQENRNRDIDIYFEDRLIFMDDTLRLYLPIFLNKENRTKQQKNKHFGV